MSSSELRLSDFSARGSGIAALIGELARDTFPGSVLLCGGPGAGKTALSRLLAAALLCEADDPGARPCLTCRSCRRVLDDTHPDLLTPTETKKKSIGADEVRGILSALQSHALESARRVVLLDDADRLTAAAQNSLLKNLEEHPPQTHFILTTAYENRVLSTIRSRVITVRIAPMPENSLIRWLGAQGVPEADAREYARLSDGSPGQALQLAQDESDRRLRALAAETLFRLTDESDIPEAEFQLKDLKDDFDAWLRVVERELRLMLHSASGVAASAVWQAAAPGRLARVLSCVITAEQQRASNVNFQAVLHVLLQKIMEEISTWQSS